MALPNDKTVELTHKKLGIVPRKGSLPYIQILTGENVGQIAILDKPEMIVGRAEGCDVQLLETGISRMHARLTAVLGSVIIEDLGSTNGTFVSERQVTKAELNRGETISFGGAVLAKLDFQTRSELAINQEVYEQVTSDLLTKTLKHDAFYDRLKHQRSIAIRDGHPFSLMLVRIDKFVDMSQTSVHDVGYVILKQLAGVLRQSTRLDDLIGRYDNETFVIYSHGTDPSAARLVADRILANVAGHRFQIASGERTLDLKLTASVGVAQWITPMGLEMLTSNAQLCLERAMQVGNQVRGDFPDDV